MPSNPRFQQIETERITFDPDNPRLPDPDEVKRDETSILNWMLDDASILELMGSIGEHGFFPGEPLLVVPNGGEVTTST
jgi:hypothetical protein